MGLLEVASGEAALDVGHLASLFIREAAGGAVFGLAIGLLAYRMLKSVDNYQVEILLSLALVWAGSAVADALHISGPLAMVAAGLLIGNPGRRFAMSRITIEHLDLFWEMIDESLNAVLFVAIGLEILVLTFSASYLVAGSLAIVIVLAAPFRLDRSARLVAASVGPIRLVDDRDSDLGRPLHGGISVALALSLPTDMPGSPTPRRELILATTYVVVVFSILVQGLTFGPLSRRWVSRTAAAAPLTANEGVLVDHNVTRGRDPISADDHC